MDQMKVKQTTLSLLRDHYLYGWTVKFNTNSRTIGVCKFKEQRIEFSTRFPMTEEQWMNVITHEVAHAIHGWTVGDGHGPRWQQIHRSMGGDGERYQHAVRLPKDQHKYRLECAVNGRVLGYVNRKGKRLASSVCRCHEVSPVWITQR